MDKIRWGILSTANIARNALVPAIQSSRNGQVYAAASRDLARARAFADEFGIERAYGSYEELLADAQVDAVYIPLPNDGHAPWSMAAARAKKPTLCEKPLALNAGEAGQMVDAFRAAGVLLAETFMYRYHPQHQQVRQLLTDGAISEVSILHAAFTYSMPIEEKDNVRLVAAMGGGGLLDIGCYCVNLIRMMAGEEPDSVSGHATVGRTSGVDEAFVGTLHFPSGLLAHFDCGMRGMWRQQYTLVGSMGSITVPSAFRPLEEAETQIELLREDGQFHLSRAIPEIITVPPANQYRLMVEDFGDAVREGRTVTYDPVESVRNMRFRDGLIQAAKERRVVQL